MSDHATHSSTRETRTSRLGLFALFPLVLFALALQAFRSGAMPVTFQRSWIPYMGIDLAFRLDGLALLFVLLITGVGFFVFIYAAGYMAGVAKRERLFVLLAGFMVAMLGAVTADDLFLLFIFWELTSITSFLLVGFKHESIESRKAAQQALMITAGGGLALLAGFLLLAQAAGTSSVHTLIRTFASWRDDPVVTPALILVFIGAFTKSAQVPFHFWLPGAMAAPTPVSAYLHSATMVKLGVYLLARLHPAFDDLLLWEITLVGVGAVTSVWAAVLIIRERDLKRIFAWSTVSSLGTLVMLIGLPGEGAATATAVFVLAHALYKAPLFFIAGNVDLATGTRVIDELGALGRRLRLTAVAAGLAGISMAGVPLSFGYIAKDVIKLAKSESDVYWWVAYAGVFVSAISVAAAAIATVRIFRFSGEVRPAHAREGSPATWLPPLGIAAFGVLLGVQPWITHDLLSLAAADMGSSLSIGKLRASMDNSARLSALLITLGLGFLIYVVWDRLHAIRKVVKVPDIMSTTTWYRLWMSAIPWVAGRTARLVQGGRLPRYTAILLGTALLLVGAGLGSLAHLSFPAFEAEMSPTLLAVAGVVVLLIGASIAVCLVRDSFVMLLMAGVIGLAAALLFLFLGAPDVAFTQVAVDVAFVVVIAAVLLRVRNLDLGAPPRQPPGRRTLRILLALGVGALTAGLLLFADGFAPDSSLARFFAERSVPDAHGRNVVNVILVDFRAMDTLGEIIVVMVTFLASLPLLRLLQNPPVSPSAPGARAAPREAGACTEEESALRTMGFGTILLSLAARVLYPVLLLGALIILLRGHNKPGGGFIAGMIAVAATSLLAVARGSQPALSRMPLGPTRLAATSALIALGSGLPALFYGRPFLTHLWATVPLGVTEIKVSTVMLFDLGVFGTVWGALGGLCARMVGLDEAVVPPTEPSSSDEAGS
jgi:multicomponent Na+:H+ antiporter subunit A